MSTKTYTEDPSTLLHIISKWEQIKTYANNCLNIVETANQEILAYLNNHTPLSNPDYGHLGGFRIANRTMSSYITKLPAYLKQIKSGICTSPVNEETLEQLKMIAYEATEWKTKYNKAVAEYKALKQEYESTFYNTDGTFDIVRWLE